MATAADFGTRRLQGDVIVGSARYSVPTRLIGATVTVTAGEGRLLIADPATAHDPSTPVRARTEPRKGDLHVQQRS